MRGQRVSGWEFHRALALLLAVISRPSIFPQTPINSPIPNYCARKVHLAAIIPSHMLHDLKKKKRGLRKIWLYNINKYLLRPSTLQTSLYLLIHFWKKRRFGGGSWRRERVRERDQTSIWYHLLCMQTQNMIYSKTLIKMKSLKNILEPSGILYNRVWSIADN